MNKKIKTIVVLILLILISAICFYKKEYIFKFVNSRKEVQEKIANEKPTEESKNGVKTITETVDNKSIKPLEYSKLLGKGLDVDWSKNRQGTEYYNSKTVSDFKEKGISHVRIRISQDASEELFIDLDKQIEDCIDNGIIPVIAYQANEFKESPSDENISKVVTWWKAVAERYKSYSYRVSFDLIIEATDALNKQPEKLNEIYEQIVTEIRKSNPERILMISPRLRSDPAYLNELKIPTKHNDYLMAEFHFYASGPSKTNENKLWTTGEVSEKDKIKNKINLALDWQRKTGIPVWVGAWMPGNYNDENDYSIPEQVKFAGFVSDELEKAKIPFAVNSDTKFYYREKYMDQRYVTSDR